MRSSAVSAVMDQAGGGGGREKDGGGVLRGRGGWDEEGR